MRWGRYERLTFSTTHCDATEKRSAPFATIEEGGTIYSSGWSIGGMISEHFCVRSFFEARRCSRHPARAEGKNRDGVLPNNGINLTAASAAAGYAGRWADQQRLQE